LTDIVPKRYDEFSSLVIKKNEKIRLKVFDWFKNEYIKEVEI
jgi:hypothetical protein